MENIFNQLAEPANYFTGTLSNTSMKHLGQLNWKTSNGKIGRKWLDGQYKEFTAEDMQGLIYKHAIVRITLLLDTYRMIII